MARQDKIAEFNVFKTQRMRGMPLNVQLGDILQTGRDCAAIALTISKTLTPSSSSLKRIKAEEKLNNAKLAFHSRPGHGDVLALDFTDTDFGKFVFLAVHPTADTVDNCYKKLLELCARKRLSSLALPCIGSGNSNRTTRLSGLLSSNCATSLAKAINHSLLKREFSLKTIKIVDRKEQMLRKFTEVLDEKLKNKQIVEDEEETEESEGDTTIGTMSLLDEDDSDEGEVLVVHTGNGVQGLMQDNIDMHGWTQDERTAAQYVNFDITPGSDMCAICISSLMDVGNETLLEMENKQESLDQSDEASSALVGSTAAAASARLVHPVAIKSCQHQFHFGCFVSLVAHSSNKFCPTCRKHFAFPQGDMPLGSTMAHVYENGILPGFEGTSNGTILIIYQVPSGIQGPTHIRPGHRYYGTIRYCYLPRSAEGLKVLRLLQKAFECRLTFTVGDSITSGARNVAVWNGIHHKTSTNGGPAHYGYPDSDYLARVTEELAQAGITEDMLDQPFSQSD
ncbi:hypothetical protein WR25_15856 [Diploscapter pachys]|uniref:E3 ubiquitin-protein ligase n=1 Tax=Diploscapter pachys TaxID=2018661 RepID=A0A2A2J802_9BILA|nr:hypothetical protein WR25_15856 [Diploscapter pachys]